MEDPTLARIRDRLSGRPPILLPPAGEGVRLAGVALLVRPAVAGPELLLIRRAEHPLDPWSGHIAFPGGRREEEDTDSVDTAVRETREEVGIDLRASGTLLGPLDPISPLGPGLPPIRVSPYVFGVTGPVRAEPGPEVAEAVWAPLEALRHPEAVTEFLHPGQDGSEIPFPAISFREYVVWGLTHRILTQFLELTRTGGAQ